MSAGRAEEMELARSRAVEAERGRESAEAKMKEVVAERESLQGKAMEMAGELEGQVRLCACVPACQGGGGWWACAEG